MIERFYTISELAKDFNITLRTIRFYETKGLLAPNKSGHTRIYTKKDYARLTVILRGKKLGFTLTEISEYLDLYDADIKQVTQIEMLQMKVQERLNALKEQKEVLNDVINELMDIHHQCSKALKEKQSFTP